MWLQLDDVHVRKVEPETLVNDSAVYAQLLFYVRDDASGSSDEEDDVDEGDGENGLAGDGAPQHAPESMGLFVTRTTGEKEAPAQLPSAAGGPSLVAKFMALASAAKVALAVLFVAIIIVAVVLVGKI